MRRTIVVILIVIGLGACSERKVYPLSIEKDKMVLILSDVYISEQTITKFDVSERDSMFDMFKSQMAEIHGVSAFDIQKNILELQQHPVLFKELNELSYEYMQEKSKELEKSKKE
jgi:hypothetical protein